MENIAVVDIIIIILFLIGFYRGFTNGLFSEIASLLALTLGVYGAIHFSYFAENFLNQWIDWDESIIRVTAFAVTFLVILVGVSLAGKALTKMANIAMLGWANKLLGGVFGLLKIIVITSVLIFVFDKINQSIHLVPEDDLAESYLYIFVKDFVPKIFPQIIEMGEEAIQKIPI